MKEEELTECLGYVPDGQSTGTTNEAPEFGPEVELVRDVGWFTLAVVATEAMETGSVSSYLAGFKGSLPAVAVC